MTRPIVMDVIARDNASKTFKSVADSQTKLAKQTDGLAKTSDNLRKANLGLIAAQERYNKAAQSGKATAGQLASAQKSLITAQQGVAKATASTGAEVSRFGSRAKLAFAAAGVAAVGFVKSSVEAARAQQKANAQTAAVIKSTGGAAGVTAKQVGDLAGSLSKLTGIQDDTIQSGENMLLTFTNVRNEVGKGNDVFTQATKITTDMSVALGQDMKTSAIQVGKALNDPINGVTALTRVGVTFTDAQKEQIKTLVQTGDVMGAQKVILAELNKEFGGSAAAQATAADKAAASWSQFQESIGNVVLPVLDKFLKVTTAVVDAVGKYAPIIVPLVGVLSGFALAVWAVNKATAAWEATQKALTSVFGANFVSNIKGAALALTGWGTVLAGIAIGGKFLTDWLNNTFHPTLKIVNSSIKDITQSLKDSGGAFDVNAQKVLANSLEQGKFTDKAAKAGISFDQLVAGITGNDAAFDHLIQTWKSGGKPSNDTLLSLFRFHAAFRDGTADGKKYADQQKAVQDQIMRTGSAADQQTLFLAQNNLTVEDAVKKYNDAVASAHTFTAELGYMSNALATLSGNNITATLQQDQLNLAMGTAADNFAGARAQVAEHGKALQGNTADAISNRAWALQQIQAINQQAISYAQSTGSVGAGTRALGINEAALRTSMRQAGFTSAQIQDLLNKYAATPDDVMTSVRQQGAQAVLDALGDIAFQLHAIADPVWKANLDISAGATAAQGGRPSATGGYIAGPGGPTSDVIPLMASNGEYIVNAQATAKHRTLLENINRNKYAAGGLVGDLNIAMKAPSVPDIRALYNQAAGALFGGMGGPATVGGNLGAWIAAALAITGTSADWAGAIQRRIMFESGGNPNAINNWDSNAMAGDPSRGLMQTIGATFNAYHQAGTSFNIYDPTANTAAAINYIKSRYGSIFAIDPPVQGYRAGAWEVASNQLAGLHKGEMVLPSDVADIVRSGAGTKVVELGPKSLKALAEQIIMMDGEKVAKLVTARQTAYQVRGGRR